MHSRKTLEEKRESNYKDACFNGYCPSIAERNNKRIKELANRLKAKSDKETLTNVLDWQNRNVVFWFERYPLSEAIWGPIFGFILVTVIFFRVNPSIWFLSSSVLLSVMVTSLSVAIYMVHIHRRLPLKQVFNIFPLSLPINSMLDNKLGVCGDYAKLTACLLLNIYPEKEIYFVHARSHVATGIVVGNKLYVLDKYLPLATIDKWHDKWNKSWFSPKKVEKVKENYMEKGKLGSLLSETRSSELDKDRIEKELERRLSIGRSMNDTKGDSIKLFQWKKGVILYDDDELVNYSLTQRLRNVITNEMIDVKKITKLSVEKKKNDLIFTVELKANYRNN
jgi:predicted transglutaminase-like protease